MVARAVPSKGLEAIVSFQQAPKSCVEDVGAISTVTPFIGPRGFCFKRDFDFSDFPSENTRSPACYFG
jgi:hypothetical protein